MAIDVACPCGRTSRVKDEHAGKRAKCTACGNVVTVPSIEIDPELAAAQALFDDDPATPEQQNPPPADAAPPRANKLDDGESSAYGMEKPPPRPSLSDRPPPKKIHIEYKAKESSARPTHIHISPGVMSALGMIAFGVIWNAILLANDRISIYGVVLIVLGLFQLVRGLMGAPEE